MCITGIECIIRSRLFNGLNVRCEGEIDRGVGDRFEMCKDV